MVSMSDSEKKIIVLGNLVRPEVADKIDQLKPFLLSQGQVVAVCQADSLGGVETDGVDLAVVFGGDGTLLAAARSLAETGIAILGVNMGKFGFLAEFDFEQMKQQLPLILAGESTITERMMLDVAVCSGGNCVARSPAMNEVAICAGADFRMIDVHVAQAGSSIAQYLGDGLVVSTPTGTTGYGLSAGGPILGPTLDAICITPVAPHTVSIRPIVVRSDQTISITAVSVNRNTSVMLDGQVNIPLGKGDIVEVKRGSMCARFVSNPTRNFFDTLAGKLQWGRSPHHDQ